MRRNAFTLIELLVVIGIISILAAIALPNFMNATTKSRVVQAKMDLRSVATALTSYRLDHNKYPRVKNPLEFFAVYLLPELTSPVSYLNPIRLKDPFGPVHEYEEPMRVEDSFVAAEEYKLVLNSYTYTHYPSFAILQGNRDLLKEGFCLASVGPDKQDSYIVDYPFPKYYRYPGDSVRDSVYNPSNGLISPGDIGFFGGDLPGGVNGLIGG